MGLFSSLKKLMGGSGENGSEPETVSGEMLSCEHALDRLFEYLDEELEELDYARVAAHFEVCKRCYPRVKFEESFRAALEKAQEQGGVPGQLRSKIMDALAKDGFGTD